MFVFATQIYITPWIYTPMRSAPTVLRQLSKTEVKELYRVVILKFLCAHAAC